MNLTDDRARHLGKITLGAFLAGPSVALLGLLFSSEAPFLFGAPWFLLGCAGLAVVAYSVAFSAARSHMLEAPYLDSRDRKGWKWRLGTKAAPVVPFIYLLSTPAERRVGYPPQVKGV